MVRKIDGLQDIQKQGQLARDKNLMILFLTLSYREPSHWRGGGLGGLRGNTSIALGSNISTSVERVVQETPMDPILLTCHIMSGPPSD